MLVLTPRISGQTTRVASWMVRLHALVREHFESHYMRLEGQYLIPSSSAFPMSTNLLEFFPHSFQLHMRVKPILHRLKFCMRNEKLFRDALFLRIQRLIRRSSGNRAFDFPTLILP